MGTVYIVNKKVYIRGYETAKKVCIVAKKKLLKKFKSCFKK